MYKINDYILHKREVCRIKDIKPKYFQDKDYYVLSPVTDESLTINVPIDSKDIKDILTKEQAMDIIKSIKDVKYIDTDEKSLENTYKELLSSKNTLDLAKIIKTTYLRNQNRLNNGKKIAEKDNNYFNIAEKYLYTTLGIALGMSYDECKKYVIDYISNQEKETK